MNVFDVALKMELEIKEYYEKLAAETSLPGVREIFSQLAADEEKHCNAIQAMKDNLCHESFIDSEALEKAKDVLGAFKGARDLGVPLQKDLQAYRHALEVEGDSVRFYQRMLDQETDAELRKVVHKILTEEKKHYNIVENLYDYVLRPEYFLAWAEFSNLRDL